MCVDRVKQLLEQQGAESLEANVERVGYQDSSSLRRLFRKEMGLSPREYRERFAMPVAPAA